MELIVTVREKIAQGDGTRIVCGNSDYTVRFDLDEEWEQFLTRTMVVVNADMTYSEHVFTGDTVALPVINNQNGISIGLYAGDLHTTTPAYFDCEKSARCGLGAHKEPAEDVYNQLVQLVENGAVKGDKGDKGDKGEQGEPGKDGSDADVTAENIQSALGYAPVEDVRVNGVSVLTDGVANVPLASTQAAGVIAIKDAWYGGLYMRDGALTIAQSPETEIAGRSGGFRPITPTNLDYAVKAAMCDGKGAEWTADEQKSAQKRMGLIGDWALIEEITVGDEVTVVERSTTPDGTAYDFRQVFIRVGYDQNTNTSIAVNGNGLRFACNAEGNTRLNEVMAYIPGDCTEAEALITYDGFLSIRTVGRTAYYNGRNQMEVWSLDLSTTTIKKIIVGHYQGITAGVVIRIWGRK